MGGFKVASDRKTEAVGGGSGFLSKAFPCGVQGGMSSHKVVESQPLGCVDGCFTAGSREPRSQMPLLGSLLLSTIV